MVERLVAKLGRERAISAVLERLPTNAGRRVFPVENIRELPKKW
jgi:hypothetical protein